MRPILISASLLSALILPLDTLASNMTDHVYNKVTTFLINDNAQEMDERRDYYKYVVETQGETRPFELFNTTYYGRLGSFGTPLPEKFIESFDPLIPFPKALVDFYRKYGSLQGIERQLNLTIFDLTELNNNRIARPLKPHFRSFGLVDMIEYLWDERDQINPDSDESIFTAEEIKWLNESYHVVGYWLAPNEFGEAMHLLYYDKSGLFGIAYLHQDNWDIAYLLKTSGAKYEFSNALEIYLEMVREIKHQ